MTVFSSFRCNNSRYFPLQSCLSSNTRSSICPADSKRCHG